MCVCVCVRLGSSLSFKHVLLNNKDTFCLNNFIRFLSRFQDYKCFDFWLELLDEFTEIVPSTFRPFIGHYHGSLDV